MYPKSLLSRRTRATNRTQDIPARGQWWHSFVLTHRARIYRGLHQLHTLALLRSGNLVGHLRWLVTRAVFTIAAVAILGIVIMGLRRRQTCEYCRAPGSLE
jgi:hypothetical protein